MPAFRQRGFKPLIGFIASMLGGAPAQVRADALPWTEPGSLPLPPDARSAAILQPDEPIRTHPDGDAPRRGSAMQGAFLPVYGAARGPGCRRRWILVGPTAWVCGDNVDLTRSHPVAPRVDRTDSEGATPFDYYFVGPDGTFGYAKLRLAEEGIPDARFEPGFAVGVVQVARKSGSDPFGLTTKGFWVPVRDLIPARPAALRGVEIQTGSELNVAWTLDDETRVYPKPNGAPTPGRRLVRWTRLGVEEERKIGGQLWLRVASDEWMRERDVRRARPSERPPGLRPGERWIDVDVEQQVLTAYEGDRPVFSTLVSSGRGRGKDPSATPKGVHRIWVKLRTSDMTNLEDEEASRYYSMQEVPWVMYFEKGYGLHGAYWHQSFGRVRSHGCVNLTPEDARILFDWSSPRMPAGWSAVLPTEYDWGTVVRVR